MIEGTWRIVKDEDGGDVVYLFRKAGGYVSFHLDGEESCVLTSEQQPFSSKVFGFADWMQFVDHIRTFLRVVPSERKDSQEST